MNEVFFDYDVFVFFAFLIDHFFELWEEERNFQNNDKKWITTYFCFFQSKGNTQCNSKRTQNV